MHIKLRWADGDGQSIALLDALFPFYDQKLNDSFWNRRLQFGRRGERAEASLSHTTSSADSRGLASPLLYVSQGPTPKSQYSSWEKTGGDDTQEATTASGLRNRLGSKASWVSGPEDLQQRFSPKGKFHAQREPCFHYSIGKCKYGDKCNKPHVGPAFVKQPRTRVSSGAASEVSMHRSA